MAKLIIEGDKKQLEIIAKSEKGRANKYNLKIFLIVFLYFYKLL